MVVDYVRATDNFSVFQSGSWHGRWCWGRGKSYTEYPNFTASFGKACCATWVSQSFTKNLWTGSSGAGGCVFLFSWSFLGLLLVFFLPLPPPVWDKGAGSKCHSTWGDEHGKLQQRRWMLVLSLCPSCSVPSLPISSCKRSALIRFGKTLRRWRFGLYFITGR